MPGFNVVVAMDSSPASYRALDFAGRLVSQLSTYTLTLLYIVPLNPKQIIPFMYSLFHATEKSDHLEKSFNLEIAELATREVGEILQHIETIDPEYQYEFVEIEGEGETGELIEKYVCGKDVDLVVIGSRNQHAIQRHICSFTNLQVDSC